MGTNYYVRPKGACETQCSNWVHLGKSSAGWTFTFRAYPKLEDAPPAVTWPVVDAESWMRLLDLGDIYDEYGQVVTSVELPDRIERKIGGRNDLSDSGEYVDGSGARFISAEFS